MNWTSGSGAHVYQQVIRRVMRTTGLLITILAVLCALSGPFMVSAASSYVRVESLTAKMLVDGKTVKLAAGQHVFIVDGRLYVPLRASAYLLHRSIGWNASTSTVAVTTPTKQQAVQLNNYLASSLSSTGKSIEGKGWITIAKVDASYLFDGVKKKLPAGQSSYMFKGSLYVPLRFIAELTGGSVVWDAKTKLIMLRSPASSQGGQGAGSGSESGLSGGSSAVRNGSGPKDGAGSSGGSGTKDEANSDNGKNTTPSIPSGGGGMPSGGGAPADGGIKDKPSYDVIRSTTETKLAQLRTKCQQRLTLSALQYAQATDAASRKKASSAGEQELAACQMEFETTVISAEKSLQENGYSTAITAEYRKQFTQELQEGKEILAGLIG